MDALIYIALSGAERALNAQQVHANNLANMDTAGFRATLELATAQQVPGYGYDARYKGVAQANVVVARESTLRSTGRDLDVGIAGQGFFAVQWRDGEAYTRAGAMTTDADGALTVNGNPVLGEGGPIMLPPYSSISIGQDGTISIQPPGEQAMQVIDKLKLVKPDAAELTKNEAGLIVSRNGDVLPADPTVVVQSGHLEGSNVSAVEEMVATMNLNRTFEMQMKLYTSADAMTQAGNRLVGA
jgi:flagellar basal-body rod protein FlgF